MMAKYIADLTLFTIYEIFLLSVGYTNRESGVNGQSQFICWYCFNKYSRRIRIQLSKCLIDEKIPLRTGGLVRMSNLCIGRGRFRMLSVCQWVMGRMIILYYSKRSQIIATDTWEDGTCCQPISQVNIESGHGNDPTTNIVVLLQRVQAVSSLIPLQNFHAFDFLVRFQSQSCGQNSSSERERVIHVTVGDIGLQMHV